MLYLDANADAPVLPQALRAYLDASALFANPSSSHAAGRAAKERLAKARDGIAAALECEPDELVFTSGGTESDALALHGVLERGDHVVTTSIEHPAVHKTLGALEQRGVITVSRVAPERSGRVNAEAVLAALRPQTRLVSVVLACNETGVLQPVYDIAEACRARGVLVHTDAVQALGRTRVSFAALQVDLLALSGHKLGAVPGVGALVVRRGLTLAPLFSGGGQEGGRRAGTENLPGICSLDAALRLLPSRDERARQLLLRNLLESRLSASLPRVEVIGAAAPRLCNTTCVRFAGCAGDGLLMALDLHGIHVSTGSACSSGSIEPSEILLGMGLSKAEARETLRLSLTRKTTGIEIERVAAALTEVAARMRAAGGDN